MERHKIVPAVFLILENDKKQILLMLRKNTGWKDGQWDLVSGHVEAGETAKTAMIRETKEEVGIEINQKDLKFVHFCNRHQPENDRADFYFTASKWKGAPKIKEPDKCEAIKWFSLNDFPQNTIDYTTMVINCCKSGVLYSEFGWN